MLAAVLTRALNMALDLITMGRPDQRLRLI
jgi:hypothetical protein